jgi:hypothetical protein
MSNHIPYFPLVAQFTRRLPRRSVAKKGLPCDSSGVALSEVGSRFGEEGCKSVVKTFRRKPSPSGVFLRGFVVKEILPFLNSCAKIQSKLLACLGNS